MSSLNVRIIFSRRFGNVYVLTGQWSREICSGTEQKGGKNVVTGLFLINSPLEFGHVLAVFTDAQVVYLRHPEVSRAPIRFK